MPHNAGAVFAFLTSQEIRGDDRLKRACDLESEVRTVASEKDLKVIEDKIAQ
jgi:hypothetical protein